MSTIPRTDAPSPSGLIAREWATYAETVLPADTEARAAALVRLGYYAGAAAALNGVLIAEDDDMEGVALEISAEILDAVDRDLLDATNGVGRYARDA